MAQPLIRRERYGIVFTAMGEWEAGDQAEAFLKQLGFSLGSDQRGAPTAVMFGDYAVSKWKNLNQDERRETHATLTGDRRYGPVTFRFLPAAPDEAVKAVEAALAEQVEAQ